MMRFRLGHAAKIVVDVNIHVTVTSSFLLFTKTKNNYAIIIVLCRHSDFLNYY